MIGRKGIFCMRFLLVVFILLFALPAKAQEFQPGDACTNAGQFVRTGGPEISGGHFMICDGSNWISFTDYADTGRTLFQVGHDAGTCVAGKQGRLRYASSSDLWQYCDGANWTDLAAGSGSGLWFQSGSDIYYNSGNVGIGTQAPDAPVHFEANNPAKNVLKIMNTANDGYSSIDFWRDDDVNALNFGFANEGAGNFIFAGNTYINYKAGSDFVFAADNTEIMRLTSAGRLGIGTAGPEATLHVHVASGLNRLYIANNGTGAGNEAALWFAMDYDGTANWAGIGQDSDGSLRLTGGSDLSSPHMIIDDSGNVGIGDTTPDVALDVIGDINFTGQIVDVSDRRLKTGITPLSGALAKITALQGVSFTMKDNPDGKAELGLIAQDVEPVFPELVSTGGDGIKGLNYDGFIAPLIEAVKAQQEQIEALQDENEALRTEIEALKAAQPSRATNPYND